jgi:hypothetical protein
VSQSALSNIFANYLIGHKSIPHYYELGQGRMGVPLWEDPQRYVENSPITHWNKVRTPLLIVHGEADGTVPALFSTESFYGMQRLGGSAILARYSRLGHSSNPEMTRRVRGWFREHLLGAPAITHIADQGSFFLGGERSGDVLAAPLGIEGPVPPVSKTTPNTP